MAKRKVSRSQTGSRPPEDATILARLDRHPSRAGEIPTTPAEPARVQELEDPVGDFTTLDVINGLQGICRALDEAVVNQTDLELASRLSMAANILSSILSERVIVRTAKEVQS